MTVWILENSLNDVIWEVWRPLSGSRFVEACRWVRSVLLNTRYILRVLHKLTRLVGVWADSDPDAQLRLPVRKCELLKYEVQW